MMPVSSAVKISLKSITMGEAPSFSKILVSMPGGERNFQSLKSATPRIGLDEASDSWP